MRLKVRGNNFEVKIRSIFVLLSLFFLNFTGSFFILTILFFALIFINYSAQIIQILSTIIYSTSASRKRRLSIAYYDFFSNSQNKEVINRKLSLRRQILVSANYEAERKLLLEDVAKLERFILRDFVEIWANEISPGNRDILQWTEQALVRVRCDVVHRLVEIPAPKLVDLVVQICAGHLSTYRAIFDQQHRIWSQSSISQIYSLFEPLHVACSNDEAAKKHFGNLLDIILSHVGRENTDVRAFLKNGPGQKVLTSILTQSLLTLLTFLCDPDTLNQIIILILTAIIDKEEEDAKSGWNARDVDSTSSPNSSSNPNGTQVSHPKLTPSTSFSANNFFDSYSPSEELELVRTIEQQQVNGGHLGYPDSDVMSLNLKFRRRQSNPVGWMVGKVTDRNKNRSLKKANSLKGKRDDLIGQRQIVDASEAAEVSANRALGKKSSALSRFNLRKRRLHSEDIGNVNVNADLFRLRSINDCTDDDEETSGSSDGISRMSLVSEAAEAQLNQPITIEKLNRLPNVHENESEPDISEIGSQSRKSSAADNCFFLADDTQYDDEADDEICSEPSNDGNYNCTRVGSVEYVSFVQNSLRNLEGTVVYGLCMPKELGN
ncbi:uncharacterized protein LOC134855049 [Symsagittifera roscoffensis]|uniref:uncharacterized protein LOC134855049 n=1 Tax=Symsagittifera roscoffensis TaxID=84072 RepID=UPI00307B2E46